MPCKHEGGTEPCNRNSSGDCRVARHQTESRNSHTFGSSPVSRNVHGASAEKLVISTLLKLGFHVWEPAFEGGKHDLFFEADSRGWTVQVKMCRVNKSTGHIRAPQGGSAIRSDIVAAVWLPTSKIRWIAKTAAGLPQELVRVSESNQVTSD